MTKGTILMELRPNRLLLDPSFGGYKLSLDSIPIYRKRLESGIQVIHPGDNQYSFSHAKIFSYHNHLHSNPYKPENLYFIDSNCKIFKIIFQHQNVFIKEVFQIPKSSAHPKEKYNASVFFAAPDDAIISDGMGSLYVINITENQEETWTLAQSDSLLNEELACVLADAKIKVTQNQKILNILLLFVEEKSQEIKEKSSSLFQTTVRWKTFSEENSKWKEKCSKDLYIDGSIDYIAFEPECKSIYIICDKPPNWLYDSENSIVFKDEVEVNSESEPKCYSWNQTEDDITIWLPLPESTPKTDILVSVDDLKLSVKVKNESVLEGDFFHRVSKDLTTWTIDKNNLEIQLTKYESGLIWKYLISGNEKGEEIINPELVKSIHEKLAHLCSDKEETGSAPTFNSQQLEECDAVSCDTTSLFRINGTSHLTTHEISLSSLQWLFKVCLDANQPPAICVRHDVDACVWQFKKSDDETIWPYEHVNTFSAFGYVQASKTQKKFMVCPPNLSYVSICEASHHIYLYRQPSPLNSELKNRHTGKKVETISKQQLVNLETKEPILGIHATNNLLYVLLENTICVLAI